MIRALVTKRWPELALVLLGCTLRLALGSRYEIRLGYDFYHHGRTIAWWMEHFALPPIDWSREAYHPPLYYALLGLLGRAGVGLASMGLLSVLLGCFRLGLLAVALEIYLPASRMARLLALALAAILPASVHMDVMVTNEALAAALATLAIVLVPLAFAEASRTRFRASLGLGFALGLALLTKMSSLVIWVALAATAALVLLRERGSPPRARLRRVTPVMMALAIALLCSGWYFAYCKATYGKAFVTGFDSWRHKDSLLLADKPLWARRPPGYFLAWNLDIYAFPFYPAAALPEARFFPQLLAATFADYYNYGLAPYPQAGAPERLANRRPLRPSVVTPAAVSVASGTLIALITVAAFVGAWVLCWRRRAYGMLALLLVPALALAGQAYFAVTVANDAEGLVKGSYLQFAAAPLFPLFGLGVAWSWQRRRLRAIVPLALLALAGVAWYVVFCLFFA